MNISGSNFYSGINVNSQRNNSLPPNKPNNTIEEKRDTPKDIKRYTEIVEYFYQQKSSNIYKDTSTYSDQRAIEQYQSLENLEKNEYAKNALGFSLYA